MRRGTKPLGIILTTSSSAGIGDIVDAAGADIPVEFLIPENSPRSQSFLTYARHFANAYAMPASMETGLEVLNEYDKLMTFDDRFLEAADKWNTLSNTANPYDKLFQRRTFNAAGASQLQCFAIDNYEDLVRARARTNGAGVLKPRRSSTGRGIIFATQSDSSSSLWSEVLKNMTRDSVSYMYEETFVDASHPANEALGPYVSVDGVIKDNVFTAFTVVDKPPQARTIVETGDIGPTQLSTRDQSDLIALAATAIHSLQLTDRVAHVEIRFTTDGPQVVEVNARLGGSIEKLCRSLHIAPTPVRLALEAAWGEPASVAPFISNTAGVVCCLQIPLIKKQQSAPPHTAVRKILSQSDAQIGIETPEAIDDETSCVAVWLRGRDRRQIGGAIEEIVRQLELSLEIREVLDLEWLGSIRRMGESYA